MDEALAERPGRGRRPLCRLRRRPNSPLHCDEVWRYDDEAHVATLVELRAVCPDCHAVKHMGRTGLVLGKDEARALVMARLIAVNGWDEATAAAHVTAAWAAWRERCLHDWTLDMGAWEAEAS